MTFVNKDLPRASPTEIQFLVMANEGSKKLSSFMVGTARLREAGVNKQLHQPNLICHSTILPALCYLTTNNARSIHSCSSEPILSEFVNHFRIPTTILSIHE